MARHKIRDFASKIIDEMGSQPGWTEKAEAIPLLFLLGHTKAEFMSGGFKNIFILYVLTIVFLFFFFRAGYSQATDVSHEADNHLSLPVKVVDEHSEGAVEIAADYKARVKINDEYIGVTPLYIKIADSSLSNQDIIILADPNEEGTVSLGKPCMQKKIFRSDSLPLPPRIFFSMGKDCCGGDHAKPPRLDLKDSLKNQPGLSPNNPLKREK